MLVPLIVYVGKHGAILLWRSSSGELQFTTGCYSLRLLNPYTYTLHRQCLRLVRAIVSLFTKPQTLT